MPILVIVLLYALGFHSAKEMGSKDSIARPLYSLISEIFELKGAFKLLRKTLVQLVQVTYGKSINRLLILLMCVVYVLSLESIFLPLAYTWLLP